MYDIIIKHNRDAQECVKLRGICMSELIRPAHTLLPMSASFAEISGLFSGISGPIHLHRRLTQLLLRREFLHVVRFEM